MDDLDDTTGIGAEIEVWNEFTERWTRGFAVAEVVGRGYRVRRSSDGAILPVSLDAERVRGASAPFRILPAAG